MRIKLPLYRKLILFLIPPTLFVFGIAIFYIIIQARLQITTATKEIANKSAEKYAQQIKAKIDADFNIARTMSYTFQNYNFFDNTNRKDIFNKLLKDIISNNPNYASFWLNYELSFVDSNFINKPGRVRYTYYRDKNKSIKYMSDTLETSLSEININGAYYKMKASKLETITEPYFFTYTGDTETFLETSICVPILKDGKFAGLTGSDILLNYFQDLINTIDIYGNGSAYLISNKGTIVASPDNNKIGKIFSDEYPEIDTKYNISSAILKGKRLNYTDNDVVSGKESYVTYVPITFGNTVTPWSFSLSVPFDSFKKESQKVFIRILIISILGLSLLSFLIYFIAKTITNPLKHSTNILKKLSKGEIDSKDKLKINTGDEIEEIADSVNTLIDSLSRTAEFAKTIGKGNLTADYQKAGENDILGDALINMRQSLIKAKEEEEKRKKEEEKQNWATQGLAKFSEILRQNNQDIKELSVNIIKNIVDYTGAIQGGIFIIHENEDGDVEESYYELTGSIAYNRQKTMDAKFKIGEGLIGRCAYEKLTIYIEDVPEDYVHITSGLGESNPRSVLIVPAILNDEIYAIIELISFNKFKDYQIKFVEKIGETIASTIANAQVNEKTQRLLEQSKRQSEELAAQEEEMRQNLEELQATQEEVTRLRKEEQENNKKMIEKVEKYQTALSKILDYIPVKIFLKDSQGKMLIVNKKVLEVHNETRENLIGKTDFDLITDYNEAKKDWDTEQEIIKSGQPINFIVEENINDNKTVLDTTKYPFYIDYLEEVGILSIQIDITDNVKKDEIIKHLQDEIAKLKEKYNNGTL